MKNTYSSQGQLVMWHDDLSLATSVFLLTAILIFTVAYLVFSPTAVQLRQLMKFNHFTEFDKIKQADPKFQLLKQETMRIDNHLMQVDQSKFEIRALQVNEDDGLCQAGPACVPLLYNVTISSIHGNVFLQLLTAHHNFEFGQNSLQIEEKKNEL
jgi:hypothetical protein